MKGNTQASILQKVYPVGSSLYFSTADVNPKSLFGFGTWENYGSDRVLIGKGSKVLGSTGGSETHTLTVNEMPSHNHSTDFIPVNESALLKSSNGYSVMRAIGRSQYWSDASHPQSQERTSNAGGQSFSIVQPYIVVNIWRRVS